MTEVLPCLMLPLSGRNVLLPTAAVVEILPFETPKLIKDVPDWLAGILSWRGAQIPLVHFEKVESHLLWNQSLSNASDSPEKGIYVAVINRIYRESLSIQSEGEHKYPFLSIVLSGVPKLYRVSKDNIKLVAKRKEEDLRYMMEVKLQNNFALIPDLTYLWNVIDALPSRLQWFRQILL